MDQRIELKLSPSRALLVLESLDMLDSEDTLENVRERGEVGMKAKMRISKARSTTQKALRDALATEGIRISLP
jgi:hypothetical protein